MCKLIYIVKRVLNVKQSMSELESPKVIQTHKEWSCIVQSFSRFRLELGFNFPPPPIFHLTGLVSFVTPLEKVWSRFYNGLFVIYPGRSKLINLCNFPSWGQQQMKMIRGHDLSRTYLVLHVYIYALTYS